MQSLFPQFGSSNAASSGNSLISFKAGKLSAEEKSGGKFLVTADKRKGQISIVKGDDQLIHFQWKDRQTGQVPDDFILFPDDATFKKVETGRDQDRVYLLQYKGSSRRFFFWMQSKDNSKDTDNAKKVNEYMNNPSAAQAASNANTTAASSGAGSSGGSQLDQNALLHMLGAFNGGTAGGANGGNAVQMADLQNILQNMGLPAPNPSSANSSNIATSGNSSGEDGSSSQDEDEEMSEEEMLQRAIAESMRGVDNSGGGDNGGDNGAGSSSGNASKNDSENKTN